MFHDYIATRGGLQYITQWPTTLHRAPPAAAQPLMYVVDRPLGQCRRANKLFIHSNRIRGQHRVSECGIPVPASVSLKISLVEYKSLSGLCSAVCFLLFGRQQPAAAAKVDYVAARPLDILFR